MGFYFSVVGNLRIFKSTIALIVQLKTSSKYLSPDLICGILKKKSRNYGNRMNGGY